MDQPILHVEDDDGAVLPSEYRELAAAIIARAVLDLGSSDERVAASARTFLCEDDEPLLTVWCGHLAVSPASIWRVIRSRLQAASPAGSTKRAVRAALAAGGTLG